MSNSLSEMVHPTGIEGQDEWPLGEHPADPGESDQLVEDAFAMTLDQFKALKVVERDAILFALLRQQAASMTSLEMKVAEVEQKARELMSPEGMEEAKKWVMERLGFGSGGMFGGMF